MITDTLADAYRSERLIYRYVEETDQDQTFIHEQIQSDPIIFALSDPGMLKPPSRKSSKWLTEQLAKSVLGFMIFLPASASADSQAPTPIGFLVLGWGGPPEGRMHHRSTGIGISLATAYQGRGYGAEAINWALDWAFRFANLHRVSIGTVGFNERAQHLYKKLGFVEEGRQREAHWHDRKWYDLISYGMLEQEWEQLRGDRAGQQHQE